MNYLGFVENEYIMKGEFFILCKKKKSVINKYLKIKFNFVDEFFFKLDLFEIFLMFFVKEI